LVVLAGPLLGVVHAEEQPSAGSSLSLLASPLVVPAEGSLNPGQVAAAELVKRASPEAIDAREASAVAYEGLDSAAAAKLVLQEFPGLVGSPAGGLPSLPTGAKLTHLVSDFAAAVDFGAGKHAVIQSIAPLAVEPSLGGERVPIDLSLGEAGGAFEPRTAAAGVQVRIPKRIAEGPVLSDIGVSLTPIDKNGSALDGATGVIDGATVFYGGIGAPAAGVRDLDTLVKPTPSGFDEETVLRSARSPERLRFRVGLPEGASLARVGQSLVRVMSAGHAIAVIPPPSAVDAEGIAVPVSQSVSGDVLTLSIVRRLGQYRYPIVLDPQVEDTHLLPPLYSEQHNWAFATSNNGAFFDDGSYEKAWVFYEGSPYAEGDYAQYVYKTQKESHIYKFTGTTNQGNGSAPMRGSLSIANHLGENEGGVLTLPQTGESNSTLCAVSPSCEIGIVTSANKENRVYFEQHATKAGSTFFEDQMSHAVVYIVQEKGPSAKMNTSEATVEGKTNPLYAGTWANAKSYVGISAFDPGIGTSKEILRSASKPGWSLTLNSSEYPNLCAGVQCEECHEAPCASEATPNKQIGFMLGTALPEGEDTIEGEVENAAGMKAAATAVKIKFDNATPHNLELLGLPSSHEIGDQTYHLRAEASDGSGSTLSSGIASIALKIDGQAVGVASGSCSPGPCGATSGEWVVNGPEFGAGQHTFSVVATDVAGNVATENVTVTVHHPSPISVGPASVDPVTGEASLAATDVAIAAGTTSLSVSRNYQSQHLSAGTNGPLGGQWTLSLSGQSSLTENLEKGMVLIAANGGQTTFTSLGSGKFKSPAGDANLTLVEKTIAGKRGFVLSNASTSSSTTFALPGGVGSVWKPTIQEGPVSTETVTFAYQTVEVGGVKVVQPVEALAPVPAGVSCGTKVEELTRGCRALTFNYATTTTATGESPSGWGDYAGHLTRVYFTAWSPASAKMTTTTVAQYSYDNQGRLRAEWDPRISPALKTLYGYDSEGHLTSAAAAGQQPWLLTYGLNAGDVTSGRLVSTSRPGAATTLGTGVAPANTAAPTLSTSTPVIGQALSVSNGTWSNAPLSYSYQWQRCLSGGTECVAIGGARNASYRPTMSDQGYSLIARVMATNAGGSVVASSAASSVLASAAPVLAAQFGTSGSSGGQFSGPRAAAVDGSGNVWVVDSNNSRIEKFSASGTYVTSYGTSGTGNVQFKSPWGIAIEKSSGNMYVTDTGNCRVEELSSAGSFVRAFGSCGSGNNQFGTISGVAIDPEGNVWVVDAGKYNVQVFTPTGSFIRKFGSSGSGNGQFSSPYDVAFANGNAYVADQGNNRIQEFTLNGSYVAQFGASGSGNGQFKGPTAIDVDPASGDLYVADTSNNRIQVFNPAGTFLSTFGTFGTGEGQMQAPSGIAVGANSGVYVVDTSNSRVQSWTPKLFPSYTLQFGGAGTGNGQFKSPSGVAVDPHGNVWASDSLNNRIEEFSSTGAFLASYGSYGSGNGQFSYPTGIAINQSTGNVYVSDEGHHRIEELSPAGAFIRAIGSEGTEAGKFKYPAGLAVDSSGNLWVADYGNNRVQELNSEGGSIQAFGASGTEGGQFKGPSAVAVAGGTVYVTDSNNNRVEEFSTSGTYLGAFGSAGFGNGQLEKPEGVAVEPRTGDIIVADTSNYRVQAFSPNGKFLQMIGTSGAGEGQFAKPHGMAFTPAGGLYVADFGNNRVQKLATAYTQAEAPAPLSTGSVAVTTVAYNVPVSGVGAPYNMSASEVEKWGQTDLPVEAAAIYPPDEAMGWPVQDYRRATVDYLDSLDRSVDVANPSGGIATTEYNSTNDVVRSLTADNRVSALKEGAKSAEVAKLLDTQSTYNSEGNELLSTLGPQHTIKLASGSEKQARAHAIYSYDEGAPGTGGPYRLVTKLTEGAQIQGESEQDVRTTVTSYSGQNNLGWILRRPTSVTTDPSGLKLVRTTIYDPATGNVVETRTPAAGAASEANPSGFLSQWGSFGSGNGQFSKPAGTAVDTEGNVWVADATNNRVQEFSSAGTYVRQITGFSKPEGIATDSEKHVWVSDTGKAFVDEYSLTGTLVAKYGGAGELGLVLSTPVGLAVGSGAKPLVYVVDRGSNHVIVFRAEGEGVVTNVFGIIGAGNGQLKEPAQIAMDSSGNLWVADAGNNRIQEFNSFGTYTSQFGTLGSGNGQVSKPKGVAIDPEGNIWVSDTGNNRLQEFNSAREYVRKLGEAGTGEGQMKEPAGIALDSTSHIYLPDTANNRVQKWISPALLHESSGTGGTHGTQIIYYSAGANSTYPSCGEHAEWANLPCQTQPAAQPNTSGVPNLPVTTATYNMWDQLGKATSTAGTDTRTATATYDSAGRVLTSAISSSVGTAVPTAKYEYNSETGALVKQSTTVGEATQTLTNAFNTLGQLMSYTDADGNVTTYEYEAEKDTRLTHINDGKGTQTYAYDETTGAIKELADSAAGKFTGSYDVEGNMTSEGYPNAMSANFTLNAAGQITGLQYVKSAHCAGTCPETWFSDSVMPSIHGQWLTQTSSLSAQTYTYDNAGRLTKNQNTPTGKGCRTSVYAYDEETNRLSVTTREPGAEGQCATEGGTVENHTYDTANRLTDTGTSYDSFGNTTKLPSVDAGGYEVTSSYYAGNQLEAQTQAGETLGYSLDPAGRTRETVATGKVTATEVMHYTGDGTTPSWMGELSGKWTRNVSGLSSALVALQHTGETPILQLANLHGDVIATATDSETATALASTIGEASPYGVPATEAPPKYSWLGAHELPTTLPSGVIAMGARSYVPQLGRFLQTDPVPGGSANAYAYTFGDPVNSSDLTGAYTATIDESDEKHARSRGAEIAAEVAAEEAAMRAEAERKAAEASLRAGVALGGEGSEEGAEEEEEEEGEEEYASFSEGVGRVGETLGHSMSDALVVGNDVGELGSENDESTGEFELRDVRGGGAHPCKYQKKKKCSGGSKGKGGGGGGGGKKCNPGEYKDKAGNCHNGPKMKPYTPVPDPQTICKEEGGAWIAGVCVGILPITP
jgi:RHS repeat-associated protein